MKRLFQCRFCSVNKVTGAAAGKAKLSKSAEAGRLLYLDRLQANYNDEKKRYGNEMNLRSLQSELVRSCMENDTAAICSQVQKAVVNMRKNRGYSNVEEEQEFISASLYAVYRSLAIAHSSASIAPQSESGLAIACIAAGNALDKVRPFGDIPLVAALMHDSMSRCLESGLITSKRAAVEDIIEKLSDTLTEWLASVDLSKSCLFYTNEDLQILRKYHVEFSNVRRSSDEGYEQSLRLVDSVRDPLSSEVYRGNPFSVDGIKASDYLSKFPSHWKQEMSSWIQVENIDRQKLTLTQSAEELLIEWKWKEKIAKKAKELLPKRVEYPLKSYLSSLSVEEISGIAFDAVAAVCSQGVPLVYASSFHRYLVQPTLTKINRKFIEKISIDDEKIWSDVLEEYALYFEQDEISRKFTLREWWNEVCWKRRVPPSYQGLIFEFHPGARKQLARFLNDLVFEACTFPGLRSRRETNLPAFSARNVAVDEESRVTDDVRSNVVPMVKLHPQMLKKFEEHRFEYIMFPANEMPMTIPPRPWIDGSRGGPEYTRETTAIRSVYEFKDINLPSEMRRRLRTKQQGRPVFDALNQLGSTPWVINESMLKVLLQAFDMTGDSARKSLLDSLSVPLKPSTITMPNIKDFGDGELSKQQYFEYKKLEGAAMRERNNAHSLWCWLLYRIVLANHFKGQILFFPHNMDFRGRVYPLSPHLSHMGDDISRCILKFAKGKPLGERGLQWLKLHCVNLTGKLKRRGIDERIAVAEEELPLMLDSARDPFGGKGWWLESEDPWQTLAACTELHDALSCTDPTTFVSHLPIHQDGSCNGLQHYAALGRDQQGANEVNLLPSDIPSDVYSSVAARVEQKRLEHERGLHEFSDTARLLRDYLPQVVPRKVIKQTVMTTVYGVTMYGAVEQIKRQLKALNIDNEHTQEFAKYLAVQTFASLHEAFNSSMRLKDWFRDCAKGISGLMKTVEWVTPLGLPVVQPYVRPKNVSGRLILAPISSKQIDAFPPNFVHSLDSSHMMLTSLECARHGITFAAVHDCFWTHASTVDAMNEICRRQFIKLHNEPIVEQCSKWFLDTYLKSPEVQKLGDDKISEFQKTFTVSVEQGQLDIQEVMKSVYFFS